MGESDYSMGVGLSGHSGERTGHTSWPKLPSLLSWTVVMPTNLDPPEMLDDPFFVFAGHSCLHVSPVYAKICGAVTIFIPMAVFYERAGTNTIVNQLLLSICQLL